MNVGVFLDWLSANSVAVAVVLLATVVLLHALRRPGGPYEPLDESNETAGISKARAGASRACPPRRSPFTAARYSCLPAFLSLDWLANLVLPPPFLFCHNTAPVTGG